MSFQKITKRTPLALLPLLFLLANPSTALTGASQSVRQAKWKLVWSDEFKAPDGAVIDPSKWVLETGGSGWGNKELETYTNRRENAHLQNGTLVITALRENLEGTDHIAREYTSARMKTKGKFTLTYGRVEARIKIPYGQGLWPAFWLLGADIDSVGWPTCGEIDIMENIGREPSIVHGTIHGPGYSGGKGIGGTYSLSQRRFADNFHVFAIEWEKEQLRFYVDDSLYKTITPADLPSGARWVFDHPFFLLLNVAVGGLWPGNPDASTTLPQTMLVDYVRVYQLDATSSRAAQVLNPSASTTDLSGTWKLDRKASTDNRTLSHFEEVTLVISHNGSTVKVAYDGKRKNKSQTQQLEYRTDGGREENPSPLGGSKRYSKTFWSYGNLISEYNVITSVSDNECKQQARDIWELSKDQQTLIIRTEVGEPHMVPEMCRLFSRAEKYKKVFRKVQ